MPSQVYEIFPAIGIARVGNAPGAFYIGPEQAGGQPILPDESEKTFRQKRGRHACNLHLAAGSAGQRRPARGCLGLASICVPTAHSKCCM